MRRAARKRASNAAALRAQLQERARAHKRLQEDCTHLRNVLAERQAALQIARGTAAALRTQTVRLDAEVASGNWCACALFLWCGVYLANIPRVCASIGTCTRVPSCTGIVQCSAAFLKNTMPPLRLHAMFLHIKFQFCSDHNTIKHILIVDD